MDHASVGRPSRLNGENIAGAAFLLLTFLFSMAGMVNAVFGILYPLYYLLAAIGIALVALGYRTWRIESDRLAKHSIPSTDRRIW